MYGKLVREHITANMNDNNLLSEEQYGFITGHSAKFQLLKVLDKWTVVQDTGTQLIVQQNLLWVATQFINKNGHRR